MLLHHRRLFIGVFAAFFVLLTPFLVIFSLGYDVNFEGKGLANTLTINLETLPRGAQVYNRDIRIRSTPLELKAGDNQTIPIKIDHPEYLPEEFLLWSKPGQNSTVRITNLVLLPKSGEKVVSGYNAEKVWLLSNSLILAYTPEGLVVQGYDFGGVQGRPQTVTSNSFRIPEAGSRWESLSETLFWNKADRFVLYRRDFSWVLFDFDELFINPISVVHSSDRQALLLDNTGKLWGFNLDDQETVFLDSDINGVTATLSPENIWIWKDVSVYRLPRGVFSFEQFQLDTSIYTTNSDLQLYVNSSDIRTSEDFNVMSVFQGIGFQFKGKFYYIPDFDRNQWVSMADNVVAAFGESNTLFWLDTENNLYSYNFLIKNQEFLGKIALNGEPPEFSVYYYHPWRRVFVYSKDQVFSVWIDKDILNDGILTFDIQEWISDTPCLPRIFDKFQYCTRGADIIGYRNTSIW